MNLSIYHEPNKVVWYKNLFKVKVVGIQILGLDTINYIVSLYDEDYHYQIGKNYLIIKDYFYDSFIVDSNTLNKI